MIITCPNCRTRFRIEPATLGAGGRTVRCSTCSHRWFVEPPFAAPPPPPADPAPDGPEEAPPRRRRAKVSPPGPAPDEGTPLASAPPEAPEATAPAAPGGGLAGWLAVALLVLLLAAAVLARNEIATALPAALPVYEALGLPVELRLGLEFRDLSSSRRADGSGTVVVAGTIANATGREVRVPKLSVTLLDERRAQLRAALFDPPQAVLPPGGTARFELDLTDPPPEARDFSISFADRP